MGYKTGVDKKQLALLPASLDEYVPQDHICRVINAFTGQLDMSALGYRYAQCKATGCSPYDPRTMLNLYLYGYTHQVRSSRRLRDEARRNVEVMWLLDGLTPDDKTICNFRKDNVKALRGTFSEFVRMCRNFGLYGEEVVAVDGTKFRANNSLKNHWNKTVIENELGRIEQKINDYLTAIEQADKEEVTRKEPTAQELHTALERLRERKTEYEARKERVEKEGEVSTVDPDARIMRQAGDGRKLDVGYNVQTVVDGKYHMIVDGEFAFEVTNCSSDGGTLHRMTERAKEILEVEELTGLADKGYYSSEDIAACEANGVTCLVAKPAPGGPKKKAGFRHEDFMYDKAKDVYICPCKSELGYKRNKKQENREYRVYANTQACSTCEKKNDCTTSSYREILRLACQDTMDIVDERTRKNKEQYRTRQEIVEHIFGTVKAVWGYKQFLCRSKPKVTAETALAYLAYNIRRTANIFKEARVQPVFR
jgi:transposase